MNMAMQRICPINLDLKLEVGRDEASIDRLSTIMLFPYDQNVANAINAKITKNESDLKRLKGFMDLKDAQIEHLRNCATHHNSSVASSIYSTFSSRIAEGINDGIVAGSCLIYFHFLRKAEIKTKAGNPIKPSQRVVFHLCTKFNLGRARGGDGDKGSGYKTVTPREALLIWEKYRRVSHLWAAFIHLKLNGKPTVLGPQDHVFDCVDISVLLFLARQYERIYNALFDDEELSTVDSEVSSEDDDKKTVPEITAPFRARYYDWNMDDVLDMGIPELDHVRNWASNAATEYVPDAPLRPKVKRRASQMKPG